MMLAQIVGDQVRFPIEAALFLKSLIVTDAVTLNSLHLFLLRLNVEVCQNSDD